MIRPELLDTARRWREPILAGLATLAALWIAGASTLRWGWLTLVLSAVILVAGGLWLREAIRRVRLAAGHGDGGRVFVEERRVLYVGRFGNVQVDLDDVTRVDLAISKPNGGSHASVILFLLQGPPVTVPLDAEGEDGFLDALCSLPGFRLDDLTGALSGAAVGGRAAAPLVTIWRRPPPVLA